MLIKSNSYDLSELIEKISAVVDSHRLEREGSYARWLWELEGEDRKLGQNEYGCADAANILYTLGNFPRDTKKRLEWVDVLQGMQNPEDGLYVEGTHYEIHTTAHCIAALELFDAMPKYKLKGLEKYNCEGVYASLKITGEATPEFESAYFNWLDEQQDEKTGFWKKDCARLESDTPFFWHLAGSFHYLFNYEHAKRPIPYPEKMIDSCLSIYYDKIREELCRHIGFAEIDWVFCVNRAQRQSGYKFNQCREAMISFAKEYFEYLLDLDTKTDDGINDLHMLFGVLCAIAELQQAVPGLVKTPKPLKLVLDRRPFI